MIIAIDNMGQIIAANIAAVLLSQEISVYPISDNIKTKIVENSHNKKKYVK